MNKSEIVGKILEVGIVAILRMKDSEKVFPASLAILEGGIKSIEVSLNTPDAINCIKQIAGTNGILPGVGTVTSAKKAREAIHAGAEFVVTPITKKEIIDTCHELGKPVISGAFTPSEIYQAHEWGADLVKIFPAETLGMKYIKAIKAPFPRIKLMPTGGVNSANIDQWFEMGADCVGIGSCFTKVSIIENSDWHRLTARAKELVLNIRHYRETR